MPRSEVLGRGFVAWSGRGDRHGIYRGPIHCDCCGCTLVYLTAFNSHGWNSERYKGLFCIDCALGLVPEFVARIGGFGSGFGVDFLRHDARCSYNCGFADCFGCLGGSSAVRQMREAGEFRL